MAEMKVAVGKIECWPSKSALKFQSRHYLPLPRAAPDFAGIAHLNV
jgi:hypothetical protein